MDIKKAYEILELSFGASKDEVEKQYKKLSLKFHPDKGGSNEDFTDLSEAKELALFYSDNKALIVVANQIVNQELSLIQRKTEIDREVVSIINKKERQVRSRYQSMKDITLVTALISGGLSLISNSASTIFKSLSDNSSLKQMLLLLGIMFGGVYLILNFFTNRLKDRIEEVKELFENKEEIFEVLLEVFSENEDKELRREEVYLLVKKKYGIGGGSPIKPSDIIPRRSTSIRSVVRLIGYKDFGKILLLKAVANKLVDEIEFKENGTYAVKFKLKR